MEAPNPEYESVVRESFARQSIMATLGAELTGVSPGGCEVTLPVTERVTQQHGYVHAGALATIADSACGCAALTLMPRGSGVLSVEFKINMLSPAAGERVVARAKVVRAGRTIAVCRAEVLVQSGGSRKVVAAMQGTMMRVEGREG